MSPTSRRIFLYWLLLLVPTLAVGTGAIVLLHREQARLDEQARSANATRIAAIEARARLIAENVELLVGEVESGLMVTLADAPPTAPDAFLDEWERSSPLVRATFWLAESGAVLRSAVGTARPESQAWLRSWLATPLPWRTGPARREAVVVDQTRRREISPLVAQDQSPRKEVQLTADKSRDPAKGDADAKREPAGMSKAATAEPLDATRGPSAPAEERKRGDISWNVAQTQNLRNDFLVMNEVSRNSLESLGNSAQPQAIQGKLTSAGLKDLSRDPQAAADERKPAEVASGSGQNRSLRSELQQMTGNSKIAADNYGSTARSRVASSIGAATSVQSPVRTFLDTSASAPAPGTKPVAAPASALESDAVPAGAPALLSAVTATPLLTPAPTADSKDLNRQISKTLSSEPPPEPAIKAVIAAAPERAPVAAALPDASRPPAPDRTGWTPWRDGGELHLIGWRQVASGAVMGVELNLPTISARLGELLPRDGEFAEAFAVREVGGAALQSKIYSRAVSSFASRGAEPELAAVSVPLAADLLPGWEVVGFARAAEAAGTGGFFLSGLLLVAIFVVAIISGGSLLFRQARRSEEEAVQKTSFVANVSHEFKTPLTTIRLYSELLEQGRVRDAAQGGDYLRTIGRETQRLARLVNNALDFSRLEQGQKKFAAESVDLAAELAALLDTHAPRVAEAGLALKRDLPAGPVPITTDRDALGQIVLNLIDNACKYAAEGGEVLVAVAPKAGGGARVRVADRGPGVPAAHRERIFEKFHRVDDALTAEKTGAGLGLSIARQLARGLGGELRYAPRAGNGAEFILELP